MKPPFDVQSDAWKRLSEDERFLLIQAVCDTLRNELRGFGAINYVDSTPDCIYVCTSLPHGTLIEEIPSQLDGIPIEQEAIRETMDAYIATFSKVLEHIAGWSKARIADVANYRHQAFTNPAGTHFTAASYVAGYLVSERLLQVRGFSSIEIRRRIEDELSKGVSDIRFVGFPGEDPTYDWIAAKERVATANAEMEHVYLK